MADEAALSGTGRDLVTSSSAASAAASDGSSGLTGTDVRDTTTGGDTGFRFDLGTPPADSTGGAGDDTARCSLDLRSVVNPVTGEVVENCAPELGCQAGECVAACAAAAAAGGSIGCDFIVPTSPFVDNNQPNSDMAGPCHALMVANPWERPARLSLSFDGQDYDVNDYARVPVGIGPLTSYRDLPPEGLPTGQVAIVFLSHRPDVHNGPYPLECPLLPVVTADTAAHGTAAGQAFAVGSDTPVQVYDIIPYGGASSLLPSASLLYPTTSWGTDYVAIGPHIQTGEKWILAVGAQDNTTVTINPRTEIAAGTLMDAPAHQATSYVLNEGETLQWMGYYDLGGSVVTADKPIGLFAGSTYLRVQTADGDNSGEDSAHQQIPPATSLGREYVGAGLFSRLPDRSPESVLYRLSGVANDTQLTWDPTLPEGAPVTLEAGQVVEFESRGLFSVRTQDEDHPISLARYMSGAIVGSSGCTTNPGNSCDLGDEEWMVALPPSQFLRRYVFFVDPTYGTSTLVVTRVRGIDGYRPVSLTCMGEITGWQPVGDNGQYEVAHVELFRANMAASPECATSQHIATSEGDFGIEVWGTDYYSSYGYAAGGGARRINEVVLDPAR